ncbi:FERM domain-containing protein [Trichostrongylus colubriformis]|uniref:FERM domain-containing protein n=1 Tax=Trichostrongylus colubriformis TaxID=6319 RepID=A0AAN8FWE8_TRICO
MHEGRPATVRLLDGEFLEISVIARLSVNDVLTLAAHHCRIAQPDTRFFGLAFVDNNDHYHWLQPGKNLLDYEFPSDKAVIQLTHNVRYFDSVLYLENPSTIEMFFLEAHQQLRKGQLDLSDIDYVRVGGLLLQVYRGDFTDDNSLINHLRSLLPFPPRLTRQYGVSQSSFEKQVLTEYNSLRGLQRGSAIVSVMQIVEKCLKYGSRLYRASESDGCTCILSINSRGIQVFENADTFRPKKDFHWFYLDNLYYKENIFSVEVRDPRSKQITDFNVLEASLAGDDDLAQAVSDPTTQVSISRRCQSIPAGVCVHTFVCESGALCRTIWTTAISQHQFFLDQKEREKSGRTQGSVVDHRELGEKLNRLVSRSSIGSSLPSLSSLHSSSSLNTMPSAKVADGSYSHRPAVKNGLKQKTGEDRQRDIELYKILRGRGVDRRNASRDQRNLETRGRDAEAEETSRHIVLDSGRNFEKR